VILTVSEELTHRSLRRDDGQNQIRACIFPGTDYQRMRELPPNAINTGVVKFHQSNRFIHLIAVAGIDVATLPAGLFSQAPEHPVAQFRNSCIGSTEGGRTSNAELRWRATVIGHFRRIPGKASAQVCR
jgi:hypothetical protein